MKHYCNPLNINYRYQFNQDPRMQGMVQVAREAADPSMIYFQGRYYIFASMTLGVWVSDDMVTWENHRLPESLPLYDYAPDCRVMGDYVYVCASKRGIPCNFYRTKNILEGPYEEIKGTFDFWDPNLFVDDDGKVYFYWGCANMTPIWGVEMDPETMIPKTERIVLVGGDANHIGYERVGENNTELPKTDEEIEMKFQEFLKMQNQKEEDIPANLVPMIKGMYADKPYIEGAWMDKYEGKYYLQYACPGAQYNTYADGVYISDNPLGPFTLAENNPYSYSPGSFLPGAGHGSTMWDKDKNLWHTATMRISINHMFERRVGVWPSGFDKDGDLFCNQNYADWPIAVESGKMDPWREPDWYLLSYNKTISASSYEEGHEPQLAVNENVQNWWRSKTNEAGEWLQLDLGEAYDVHAIQVNVADDKIEIPIPGEVRGVEQARYIEEKDYPTRWTLEGSVDGQEYFMIADRSQSALDLSHDLVVIEKGKQVRYLRLTMLQVPYDQQFCISGLRVFGKGNGAKPGKASFTATRPIPMDMIVNANANGATGYNILWGHTPEKLYHSYLTYSNEQRVGALVDGRDYYVRVDAFNENGITHGDVMKLG